MGSGGIPQQSPHTGRMSWLGAFCSQRFCWSYKDFSAFVFSTGRDYVGIRVSHPRPGGQLQGEAGGCSKSRGAKSFMCFYLFLHPMGNLNFLLPSPSQPNKRKREKLL